VKKDWRSYALHIVETAEKIERIRSKGDFMTDEILYAALLRNLQTLSEATQLLPEDLKIKFDKIPWREIRGFRNVLVHNYLSEIDPIAIQALVENDLDPLVSCVQIMLTDDADEP
jgi:uncharacterized protein with HEPN domain